MGENLDAAMNSQSGTVIFLDPGKTTGLASWNYEYDTFNSTQTPPEDVLALGNWLELLALTNDDNPSFHVAVGWERFIVTPSTVRHGTAYWSLEVIGMVKYLCLKYGFTMLQPQLPSQMSLITDTRLKAAGWYKPGKPHANDSARHLMKFLLKTHALPIDVWDKVFTEDLLEDEEMA
jgi:hypothetical protein